MIRHHLHIFFITILVVFFCGTVFSQSFRGGLSAGLTASEVSGDQAAGPHKLGLSLGVFTALELSPTSELQMEMLYIHKGSRVIPTERDMTRDYRFHLEYVEIPLLYKFGFTRFEDVKYLGSLIFEIGLSYARLLRYNEVLNDETQVVGVHVEDYHYNESNIILGLHYPVGENLNFNFRFSNSITPIRPHKDFAKTWYNWGQYHTVWNLALNYTFF